MEVGKGRVVVKGDGFYIRKIGYTALIQSIQKFAMGNGEEFHIDIMNTASF